MFFEWIFKGNMQSLILFGTSVLSLLFIVVATFICLRIGAYKITVLLGVFFFGFIWIVSYTLKDMLKLKAEYNKKI